MKHIVSLLAVIILAACGNGLTASQQADAIVIGANAIPCTMRAIAAASKADTVANSVAIAAVLAGDPACTALDGPAIDLIRSEVGAGKTAVVAAP